MNKWQSIEMMGYAYYCEKGYRILIPLIDSSGFDFVANKGDEYIRVNVKKAGLKTKVDPNSWCISKASGALGSGNSHKCDIFLVWLPLQERFITLNGMFFEDVTSKSKVIPKKIINNMNL